MDVFNGLSEAKTLHSSLYIVLYSLYIVYIDGDTISQKRLLLLKRLFKLFYFTLYHGH